MIKILIENMSCGHCAIKIKSELEANNFEIININQNDNTVLIDTSIKEIHQINKLLKKIGYELDPLVPVEELNIYRIDDPVLEDETVFSNVLDAISTINIEVLDIDTNPTEITIRSDVNSYEKIDKIIKSYK